MSEHYTLGDSAEAQADSSTATAEQTTVASGEAVASDAIGGDTSTASQPGPIPYDRFQAKVRQAQELEQRYAALEQQHAQTIAAVNQWMQQQSQAKPAAAEAPQAQEEWKDPALEKIALLEAELAKRDERLNSFDQWRQQQEVAREQENIRGAIESARSAFPHMRPADVLVALSENPHADINALAKRSHDAFVKAAMDFQMAEARRKESEAAAQRTGASMSSGQLGLTVDPKIHDSWDTVRSGAEEFLRRRRQG